MANLSDVSLGASRAQKGNLPASASADDAHNLARRQSASWVTKHTGVLQTPRLSESDKPELSIDMRISSEADTDHPVTPSDSVGEG